MIALVVLLLLVALMGGASRSDVLSLIVLRPAATLLLGYGLLMLRWEQVKAYPYLFGFAAAMLLLTLLQLVPLPPEIWSRLPGRALIVEIDRMAGLGAVWRPISLTPDQTWNSFYAMLVPLGVLVLGVQINHERHGWLLLLLVVFGLISALLALLQILGPPEGPLYFYRRTNIGAAVGLFANRNHQAALLASMFPILAVLASLHRSSHEQVMRRIIAFGVGVAFLPLIFITGSRSGLLLAAIGVASTVFLYRPNLSGGMARQGARERRDDRHRWRWWRSALMAVLIGAGVGGVSFMTIFLGRGEAFQRLFQQDVGGEARFQAWKVIWDLVPQYLPFGSGMGSFVEVFQIAEPDDLLDATYLNHAHNDWLEVVLTGGVPGIVLLFTAAALVLARLVQLVFRRDQVLGQRELLARLGLALILQLAIASLGDYPLRTPALASVFALAALWAAAPLRRRDEPIETPGRFAPGGMN